MTMPIGSPEKEINPCTMDPPMSQNNPMLNGSSKKLEKVPEPMAIGSPENMKKEVNPNTMDPLTVGIYPYPMDPPTSERMPIPNESPNFGNNMHIPIPHGSPNFRNNAHTQWVLQLQE